MDGWGGLQWSHRLISKILEDPSEALELCRHNFGHHVVQLVLERGHPRQLRGAERWKAEKGEEWMEVIEFQIRLTCLTNLLLNAIYIDIHIQYYSHGRGILFGAVYLKARGATLRLWGVEGSMDRKS